MCLTCSIFLLDCWNCFVCFLTVFFFFCLIWVVFNGKVAHDVAPRNRSRIHNQRSWRSCFNTETETQTVWSRYECVSSYLAIKFCFYLKGLLMFYLTEQLFIVSSWIRERERAQRSSGCAWVKGRVPSSSSHITHINNYHYHHNYHH